MAQATSRIWLYLGGIFVLWGYLRQLGQIRHDWKIGGDAWEQADWLINLAAGPVRRGPLGEAFLRLSDLTGISPVALVIAVQIVLVSVLSLALLALILRQRQPGMALAVLTPGLCAVIWAVDPHTGLRKELIGLVAILLIVWPGARTARTLSSSLLMLAASWGHEIGVLLIPAWLMALWLLPPEMPRKTLCAIAGGVMLSGSCAAAYAVIHAQLADTAPLCAALISHAPLPNAFCTGAIGWLADPANGPAKVAIALRLSPNPWLVPAAALAAFCPLWLLWRATDARARLGIAFLIASAPIFLLYPVALDWGRWISLQTTLPTLLLLGLGARDRLPLIRPPGTALMWLCLGLTLAVGIRNPPEIRPFGLLYGGHHFPLAALATE